MGKAASGRTHAGEAIPTYAGSEPTTIKRDESGLSHPVGEAFTPASNPGVSFKAIISKDHSLSQDLIASNALRSWMTGECKSAGNIIRADIVEARKNGDPNQILSYSLIATKKSLGFGVSISTELYNELVSFRMNRLSEIVDSENLSSVVFHQGWAQVIHESMLPALAMYLKNKGAIETLLNEPANAAKYKGIMKDGVYRFRTTPVMPGKIGGDQLAGLVKDIQSSNGVANRLFGSEK